MIYLNILLFFIILFLYIHIVHQYKRSEDLEIYEMDYSTNDHLQEVCEIKQPVLFEYKSVHPEFFSKVTYDTISETQYSNVEVKVKDINDYWENNNHGPSTDNAIDYVVFPFQTATNLMKTDSASKYFTENNQDFLEESGLLTLFQSNDTNIKPYFTVSSSYDICTASKQTVTPLRYHTGYRQYMCVNTGKVSVKMTPWKSTKYLYVNKDFENYEFRSPINVWKPQKKYMHEMDKIKFLEFEVAEGYMLSIPPYWWYSIKYTSDEDTLVCGFRYSTVMNCLANSVDLGKYYLQQHNIKKRITKTLDLQEKSNESTDENQDQKENITLTESGTDKNVGPELGQGIGQGIGPSSGSNGSNVLKKITEIVI